MHKRLILISHIPMNKNKWLQKGKRVNAKLKQRIIEVCDQKIQQKGENVGVSFLRTKIMNHNYSWKWQNGG